MTIALLATGVTLVAGPIQAQTVGAPFTPLATTYAEDFELGDGGWTSGGALSTWALGTPSATGGPAGAFSGLNAWGTNLEGNYNNLDCSWVASPALTLPASGTPAGSGIVSAARLGFQHWLVAENAYDGGVVQVSTDGGATWTTATPPGGYPVSLLTTARTCLGAPAGQKGWSGIMSASPTAWNGGEVDLTPYLGQTVHVRFAFATDSSVVKLGWYLDDVLVQVGAGAAVTAPSGPGGPGSPGGTSVPFQPVAAVYAEDFELGEGGWTTGGSASTWALGTPAYAGGPSAPASGLNSWGTNLVGNYAASECSWLQSPPITLPAAGATLPDGAAAQMAQLSYRQWLHTENSYDGGLVQVSTDGANWTTLTTTPAYASSANSAARACLGLASGAKFYAGLLNNKSDTWNDILADLTPHMGQTVQVRFAFAADSVVHYAGWYVDDVAVLLGAGATVDASRIQPPPVPDVSVPAQPLVNVYTTGFEGGLSGWTTTQQKVDFRSLRNQYNNTWATGTPALASGPAATFGKSWGTNLTGNYLNNECAAVTSPAIDLTGVEPGANVRLEMKHWLRSESGYDSGVVEASADGVTWARLTPTTPAAGYPNPMQNATKQCMEGRWTSSATDQIKAFSGSMSVLNSSWLDAAFDLSAYAGGEVSLRMRFASDPSVVSGAGWYFDNVVVKVNSVASTTFDFESGAQGWSAAVTPIPLPMSWAAGAPTSGPGAADEGTNVVATNLAGNYANGECTAVQSPPVDLTGIPAGLGVRFAARSWHALGTGDFGVVQMSVDNGAWTTLTPDGGYNATVNAHAAQCFGVTTAARALGGSGAEWQDLVADASSAAGHVASFRFLFSADNSTSAAGWYVDNVRVDVGTPAVRPPPVASPSQMPLLWSTGGTNNRWAFGAPTAGPISETPVFGTNLSGHYANSTCSWIATDAIDTTLLPGSAPLALTFEHWMRSENAYDAGIVQISTDNGTTWTKLTPVGGYGGTINSGPAACHGQASGQPAYTGVRNADPLVWSAAAFDLSSVAPGPIRLRFLFGSDSSVSEVGWYVRHVALGRDVAVPISQGVVSLDGIRTDARLDELLAGFGPRAGDKYVELIVGGNEIALPDDAPGTRAAWAERFDEAARPFLDEMSVFAAEHQGEIVAQIPAAPAVVMRIPPGEIPAFGKTRTVESLTLDDEKAVQLIKPELPEEEPTAANNQSVPMTQAPDIWALGYRGEGILISIIDTGIYAQHPVFLTAPSCTQSRVVNWKDYVSNLPNPYDDYGHGTHVAGTAAGSNECGGWSNGVAPKASLMGVKFLDSGGSGSFADSLLALNYSFNNGADVTSNSWGSSSCTADLNVVRLVNSLARAGMPSVFAAGNSGSSSGTIGGPACADLAITIGSTDKSMVVSSFSSRGPCSDPTEGGVSRICPDVVAVGSGVVSAVPTGSCSMCTAWGYRLANGTSMATPHVGGGVALMTQFRRALIGDEWDTANKAEETALRLTALDLGAAGDDNNYGSGFVQLLPIYNLLANPGVPDVRDAFVVPTADMRVGNSAPVSFRVSNTGTGSVDGHYHVEFTTPDGTSVLADRNVTLGFGGATSHAMTFTVGGNTAAGLYTYSGSFSYSWTDEDDVVHTGEIVRTGSWLVKKIDVKATRTMPSTSPVGQPITVTVTLENRGNEDASNVTFEETIRDAYVILPGEPDPFNLNFLTGGSPAPDSVKRDTNFGRTTLGWNVGDLPTGETFSISYTVVAKQAGTYAFVGISKYRDGTGAQFIQGTTTAHTATVG